MVRVMVNITLMVRVRVCITLMVRVKVCIIIMVSRLCIALVLRDMVCITLVVRVGICIDLVLRGSGFALLSSSSSASVRRCRRWIARGSRTGTTSAVAEQTDPRVAVLVAVTTDEH